MSDNDSLLNHSFEKSFLPFESTEIMEEEDNSPLVPEVALNVAFLSIFQN